MFMWPNKRTCVNCGRHGNPAVYHTVARNCSPLALSRECARPRLHPQPWTCFVRTCVGLGVAESLWYMISFRCWGVRCMYHHDWVGSGPPFLICFGMSNASPMCTHTQVIAFLPKSFVEDNWRLIFAWKPSLAVLQILKQRHKFSNDFQHRYYQCSETKCWGVRHYGRGIGGRSSSRKSLLTNADQISVSSK